MSADVTSGEQAREKRGPVQRPGRLGPGRADHLHYSEKIISLALLLDKAMIFSDKGRLVCKPLVANLQTRGCQFANSGWFVLVRVSSQTRSRLVHEPTPGSQTDSIWFANN